MRAGSWVLLLMVGCGQPNDEPPPGRGGAGGSSNAGTSGMSGASAVAGHTGVGGAGGSSGSSSSGGASCEQRWAEYYTLAMSARICDPNADTPECSTSKVVLDACNCTVPANEASADYLPARQLLTRYSEDCDFPEECLKCPASLDAVCKDDGSGTSRCVYLFDEQ